MKKLFLFILGFHMTSQKIQTTELLILLSFYFHEVLQQLNTFIYTNFRIRKGLCCSREDTWISMLLRDAASSRRRGKLLCGLKTLPIFFWWFCYLIISCLRINIWVLQAMNSRVCRKTQKQISRLVSGGHICAPQRDTNMASPYKAI